MAQDVIGSLQFIGGGFFLVIHLVFLSGGSNVKLQSTQAETGGVGADHGQTSSGSGAESDARLSSDNVPGQTSRIPEPGLGEQLPGPVRRKSDGAIGIR